MRLPALAVAALAAVAVLAPVSAQAAPTVHYVDCSASADGWGTQHNPWDSLADVTAHGAFTAGQQILFKRGTTCRGQLAPAGSGTKGSPIVIGAYGTGAKPTIAGGGTGSWQGAVQLVDQQYWTVQDLHVTNTDGNATTPFYRSGVMLRNTAGGQLAGITIQRLTVDHVVSSMSDDGNGSRSFGGISAITMPDLAGAGFTNLLISDNRIDHVGRTGIITTNIAWPAGGDIAPRITGNTVNHSRGDGIVMLGATKGRIDHNVSSYANDEWPCADCGGISPRTANAAIWTGSSQRVRIDHNEAYGTMQPGGDGEGLDIDISAANTVVEYNYVHDNDGGGVLFCGSGGAIVRFNIFENNKYGTFTFIGSIPAYNSTISNNTVYISKATHGMVARTFGGLGGRGITFTNNLIYNRGSGYYQWPTPVTSASSNTYVGTRGTAAPTGKGTLHVGPGLRAAGTGGIGFSTLAGYTPRKLVTGSAISSTVTSDFFGNRISAKRPPRGAVR